MTVAIFPVSVPADYKLSDADIEVRTQKDSGPGGQHRNKTESCVVMRHLPTGIEAKSATKNQHRNRAIARQVLEARVAANLAELDRAEKSSERRSMVGTGMRGDKIRTYRVRDDLVNDHRTGRKLRLTKVLAGHLP